MVLLRGSGGSFSFGASVEEHQKPHVRKMLGRFHDTVRMLASYPVPVACAVEGRCLGGAFELVLASHFVFATMNAIFACPEIKLGVIPPVLAAIGARRMPPAIAERIMLTGEELDASTAATFGFITGVVAEGRDVEGAALDWYGKHLRPLSAFSLRQATAASRIGLVSALDVTLREVERRYLDNLVPSHDGNEGIAAFLEKRAPRWIDA
jgi:cyclohexa-1,5-dienecarbonyl-CoA hydratase